MQINPTTSIISSKTAPIEIRKIPSILKIEDKLLFTCLPDQLEAELEELVDKVSVEVFGITTLQTIVQHPDDCAELQEDHEQYLIKLKEFFEHEEDYFTQDYGDEDSILILLELGLDFRDENGFPLRCTRYLKRQAEIAAKGKLGKLPDIAAIDEANWEKNTFAKIQEEANSFQKRKHN
jgi:hypothetical protein